MGQASDGNTFEKMKAMNAISLSWEDQMEKLKEKAIIRIQRKFRERRAARIAKGSGQVMTVKRAERKRKLEERELEAAIKKRQLEQEKASGAFKQAKTRRRASGKLKQPNGNNT